MLKQLKNNLTNIYIYIFTSSIKEGGVGLLKSTALKRLEVTGI